MSNISFIFKRAVSVNFVLPDIKPHCVKSCMSDIMKHFVRLKPNSFKTQWLFVTLMRVCKCVGACMCVCVCVCVCA